LEKIFLDTTKTYTDLFNKCAKISSKENQDNIANNGSIYICGSLQLPLPTYYTNADDKDTYLENS
jgi:hypothetical protein